MKLPLSWLKEHVVLIDSVEGIACTLVNLGLEVEGVETPRAAVAGVLVGQILSKHPHPDADKLSLLKVHVGVDEPLSIVCGASNMNSGDKVPVATVGTSLPNGLNIKKGRIRGQESFGMCCSETELGLAEESAGLLILPKDAPVGSEIGEYLDMEEAVFDISITPNRGDCMSARGIARDLAAWYGLPLLAAEPGDIPEDRGVEKPAVRIDTPEDCPLYLARRIDGIKIDGSPAWMQRRLLEAGMRPVNGVVDVMNYIMLDVGQPMHAFDADKLSGEVVIRSASASESFHALDDREIKLEAGDLVVTDATGIIALAGIMGSESSGTTDATRSLLLESALFRPARVSLSRRQHGMVSEASMRFERGIDPLMVSAALDRATAMILEFFGGKAGDIQICGGISNEPRTIGFAASRIDARLGVAIPVETDEVLSRMGFEVHRAAGEVTVNVPLHRHDVSIPEDIFEEYARIHGFDNIPDVLPPLEMAQGIEEKDSSLDAALQTGFVQAITYAFISPNEQRLFAPESEGDILLANPISDSMSIMRRSIWPGLMNVAKHNLNRQQSCAALVEKGRIYTDSGKGYIETDMLAWLLTGERQGDSWYASARAADFFDLKGEVEVWLSRMGAQARFIAEDGYAGLQAGQAAKILVGRSEVGRIGRVDAAIAAKFDLDAPVFVAEIDLGKLPKVKTPKFAAIPEFPSVSRDLVFLFDRSLTAEEILQAARKAAGQLLAEVALFDRYLGKGVPEGQVSLGIRFVLQAADRTLMLEEADTVSATIVQAMEKHFGASLRG